MQFFRSMLLVLFASLLCAASLRAATANFIASNGNFNVPGNWSTAAVPGTGDTAVIANGNTCTVSDARTVAALTLSGGNLVISSPGALRTGGVDVQLNTFSNSITGTGSLTVSGAFVLDTNTTFGGTGQLIIASGGVFTVQLPTVTIASRPILVQNGGTFNYSASNGVLNLDGVAITTESSASFNITTASTINALNGATINNAGTLRRNGAGSTTVAAPITSTGSIIAQSGTLIASGGYTDAGGSISLEGGTFQTATINLSTGSIFGFGTISGNVNQSGGSIIPGATGSPGVLAITGNYTATGGTLSIRLSGTVVGEDVSRLDVGGTATFGGTLVISLLNGYQPLASDIFQVAVATSVSGAFTGIDAGGSRLGPKYQPTALTLERVTNSLSVTVVNSTPNPARSGGDVTFAATIDNPANSPLTFKWTFGDGTSGNGNPITKAYTTSTDTVFNGQLSVFDGQQNATGTFQISVLVPNPLGTGTNISQGKTAENPLSGLQLTLTSSDAGLVELNVTENSQSAQFRASGRALGDVETSFSSDSGELPTRSSSQVVQKFTKSGIVVATATNKEPGTGSIRARVRKTIPVSSREVGTANSSIVEPQNRMLTTTALKGKFIFNKDKPDQVTYSGTFELPAGINITESQTLVFAMGNVIDSVNINSRGKALTPSALGIIKKLQLKYPRLNKENPVTQAGQTAKLTATYTIADLDLKGFDTEGIAATVRAEEEGLKTVQRSIQMAMTLSGVTYEAAVPVEFKRSPKQDAGSIISRSSAN